MKHFSGERMGFVAPMTLYAVWVLFTKGLPSFALAVVVIWLASKLLRP